MANQKVLSQMSLQALELLAKGGATANELKDLGLQDLNSAHLTALVNRGLVEAEKVVVEVPTVVKRKVNKYRLTEKGSQFRPE